MAKITKEDVKKAFLGNHKKRRKLLYEYYRNEYFLQDYTSTFIAAKISEDLGIHLTSGIVRQIRFKIAKTDLTIPDTPATSISDQPKGKETEDLNNVQKIEKEWVFTNKDDEPKENPFKNLLKGR